MKIENFGGIEVNVDEALQNLLGVGEIKIEKEDGYYVLNFSDEGDWLRITVEYERTVVEPEKGFLPIGLNTVFNEEYHIKQFSFEQLIEDLHDQNLEDVENWLMGLIANGMVKC